MLQAVAVQLKKKKASKGWKISSLTAQKYQLIFTSLYPSTLVFLTHTHTHTHTFQVHYHIIFTRTWEAIHTNPITAGTTVGCLFFFFFSSATQGSHPSPIHSFPASYPFNMVLLGPVSIPSLVINNGPVQYCIRSKEVCADKSNPLQSSLVYSSPVGPVQVFL